MQKPPALDMALASYKKAVELDGNNEDYYPAWVIATSIEGI